jgi:hypothetical protein
MWKSVLSYALSNSNYGIANMHNLYNFIVSMMDNSSEEQNNQMMDSLILHLGRTFYKDFRLYVMQKLPNSKHLPLINRIV